MKVCQCEDDWGHREPPAETDATWRVGRVTDRAPVDKHGALWRERRREGVSHREPRTLCEHKIKKKHKGSGADSETETGRAAENDAPGSHGSTIQDRAGSRQRKGRSERRTKGDNTRGSPTRARDTDEQEASVNKRDAMPHRGVRGRRAQRLIVPANRKVLHSRQARATAHLARQFPRLFAMQTKGKRTEGDDARARR